MTLFGWIRDDGAWQPTQHTITPLVRAELPQTIRQLRGFLGAFKQVSPCIKNYAIILAPLEKIAAGKNSAEAITWTDTLRTAFEESKQALKSIETYHTPCPEDVIHTYSDWSQTHGAVGGRMEIIRTLEDGTCNKLHGGFFSARVSSWQSRWLPCEGEALAAKSVLQHFKPQLQNSNNTVIHHTDSLPVCQAWQRSKTGAFSTSARIAAFLTEISTSNVEFVHTPGASMSYSDYASRNPSTCTDKQCQICKYIQSLVFTADNIVNSITIEDIERGNIAMPFTQQAAWTQAQKQDKTLQLLLTLIETGQSPEKRKTCNEFTTLKLLYNLYCKGSLQISKQGLITVSHISEYGEQYKAIVVPSNLYPGLANAMHLKTMHSSKTQLQKLMSRYFYSVGHHRMVSDVVDNCHVCLSVKQLPKELFPETTGIIEGFGSHFACDVMVRNQQHILLIREKLTQFTQAKILEKENAEEMMTAIIELIADKIPEAGTSIRTDNATPFQKLKSLSSNIDSWLKKFNIEIDLGQTFNHNRNPVAENLVKECHKEINKAGFTNDRLNVFQLTQIMRTINSRIRNRNLSAKEMCFMRDMATNRSINLQDDHLKTSQLEKREKSHSKSKPLAVKYETGDSVMIKDQLTKMRPREKFVVVDPEFDDVHVKIQKQDKKFNTRQYTIPKYQLLKVPRAASMKARERIAELAPICCVQANFKAPPSHAFEMLDESDGEEDSVYYTQIDANDEVSSDSNHETSSSCLSISDYVLSDEDSHNVEEDFRGCTSEGVVETLTRTQQLDDLIKDASQFLSQHPRPPAVPRRSGRIRWIPGKYLE